MYAIHIKLENMSWGRGQQLMVQDQYKDQIMKLDYYKERIMKMFLKRGIFPGHAQIDKRLADMDESLAIFKRKAVVSGNYFDTEEFNKELSDILQDLKILYKIAYTLAMNDYNELRAYAESHLKELEDYAARCEAKTLLETTSGYLGKTILFQSSGYDMIFDNTTAIIDLGSLTVPEGSLLACIIDAEDVQPNQVLFQFGGDYCSPYSLNHDLYKVHGNRKKYLYYVDNDEDIAITGPIPLDIGVKPDVSSQYTIYGGLDCLDYSYKNHYGIKHIIKYKYRNTPMSFDSPGIIEFYVIDGTFINFNFSKQPLKKNFSGSSIDSKNMSNRQKIVIEFDSGFSLDFVTNGDIYAAKKNGIIKDGTLYYPDSDDMYHFMVEELDKGKDYKFNNVYVKIGGLKTDALLNIRMIAIKRVPDDNYLASIQDNISVSRRKDDALNDNI